MENDAAQRAQLVYDDINGRTATYSDFDEAQVEQSRQYFDLATPELRTRPFDVLTCLVGLEIPLKLQKSFSDQLDRLVDLLPDMTRIYRVRPHLMHWEAHIVRRPGEPEPPLGLAEVADLFNGAISGLPVFEIEYRGFFIAPDGTIAFQGYGPTGNLRSNLRSALPFSSPRQNETGHISVARILDPIGSEAFRNLIDARNAAQDNVFGSLVVQEVKMVVERRWYMEDFDIVRTVKLEP